MANGGRIDFTVGFNADTKGLQPAINQLEKLEKISLKEFGELNPTLSDKQLKSEYAKVKQTIKDIKNAYNDAFNPALGIKNIQKLNQSLNAIGINKIKKELSELGTQGTQAFRSLASDSLTTNLRLKDTQTILDKLGDTLINTVKWSISSSAINGFTNSIQQAWGYAKHLDSSLNDIQIVTGKSADEMTRFAEQANKAAKKLGSSTTDYTEAALIYYQQGLSDEETAARAETTIKAANVTGQSGEAVSEQLTAVWNGYKVSAEEAELYIDKLAAVAATTASDLEELSTGMSKVASAAAIMGVDIDQLNAQLATIVSVTREAPESIGTALKTVYARMSDIKAGLDGEVTLDEYTQQMADMGINVLDANGNLRDMGEVIEEIGGKWQSMSREQQTSLAQTIAGTRQYSRMMSLFDNWDMYEKALNTSATAAGTLNEQNEIYLESTEAHIQGLQTSLEGLYDSLIDTDAINDLIDIFSTLVSGVEDFVDAIGGGGVALAALGAAFSGVFSDKIAKNVAPIMQGFKDKKYNQDAIEFEKQKLSVWGQSEAMEDPVIQKMIERKQEMSKYYDLMSAEEKQAADETIKRIALIENEKEVYKQSTQEKLASLAKVNEQIGAENNKKTSQRRDIQNILETVQEQISQGENVEISETNLRTLEELVKKAHKMNEEINILNENVGKTTSGQSIKFQRTGKDAIKTDSELKKLREKQKEKQEKVDKLTEKKEELKNKRQPGEKLSKEELENQKELVKARKELNTATKTLNKEESKLSNAKKIAKETTDNNIKQINKLKQSYNLADEDVENIVDSFNKMNECLQSNDLTNYEKELKKVKSALAELPADINAATEGLNIRDLENYNAQMRIYDAGAGLEEENLNLEQLDLQATIEGFSELASAAGAAFTSIMSFSNIPKIIRDEDLDSGEKLAQVLMAVGSGIVGLVGAAGMGSAAMTQLATTTLGATAVENGLTLSIIKATFAKIKDTAATAMQSAAQALANPAVAIAIVAFTALAIAIGNAQAKREEDAKKAQEQADASIAHAESVREEKDKIDELKSSYQELLQQYNQGEISLSELRDKTYDLCMQYEQQDMALKALIGDYQTLSTLMDEAQAQANQEVKEAEQKAQTDIRTAVETGIKKDAKGRNDGRNTTLDLKGMVWRNDDEDKLAAGLKELGVDFEADDKINTDSLVNAYLENSDKMMELLNTYGDTDAGKQLLELLVNQSENLEAYKQSQEAEDNIIKQEIADVSLKIYDSELEKQGADGEVTHVESLDAYKKAENVYVTKRLADLGLQEGDAGYQEALDEAIADFKTFALEHDALVEEVRDASILEAVGDEYLSQIDNLSEDEKNYIYLHLDTVEAYSSLEEFLSDYEGIIEVANNHSILLEMDTMLKDPDKDSFTNEELANFYSMDGAEEQLGLTLEELKSLDFQDQKIALIAASQQMKADLINTYQDTVENSYDLITQKGVELADADRKHQEFLAERYNAFTEEIGVGPQEALEVLNKDTEELLSLQEELTQRDAGIKNADEVSKEALAYEKLIEKYQSTTAAKEALMTGDTSLIETEQEIQALAAEGIDVFDTETTQGIQAEIDSLNNYVNEAQANIEGLKADILEMNQVAADSAQSLDDLQDLRDQGAFMDLTDTTENEAAQVYNKRANELYEAERMEDLDTDALREYTDHLQDISKNSEEFSEDLADNKAAAKDLAVQITRMNKGVEALSSNWEEWSDVLNNSTEGSEEYFKALSETKDAMADLLDTSSEFISEDFIKNNMEDIAQAAEGSGEAIDRLREAMLEDITMQIAVENNISQAELSADITNLQSMLDAMGPLKAGAEIDDTSFIEACNEMIKTSGMTADQVNAMFSAMGFEATFAEEEKVIKAKKPITKTVTTDSTEVRTYGDGTQVTLPATETYSYVSGYQEVDETVMIPAMTTDGSAPVINSVTKKAGGSANNASSSNKGGGGSGGGGGGGSKTPDRAKYIEDKPDRYHDVNIELAELATAYDRLGKAQEKLTSGDLIDNLNEQLEVLQKQILTYKEKLKLMEEEKSELQDELGAQGVQFSEDGSISNYEDALVNRLNQANAEIDRYNQMTAEQQEATKDADGKTLADRATEDYEAFKEALDRYDTLTSEEIPELQDSIQDAIDQQIEIQIQKFNMGIEVQLDMAEATKEFNEWKAKVIDGLKDDDLLGNTKLTMENMQIYFDPSQGEGLMTQTASHLQQVMDEIAVMQSGGTSDIYGDNMAAAMEDLTKYQEELMNQTTEWADYVQEVQDNYLNMIDEANDKIDEQRENYEFINNQLEHSLSIIEKMHGDGVYEEMAQIYELQRQSYEEQLSFQRQEVELWAQRMEEARLSGDTEALEKYTENWKDAQEELDSLVEAALDNLLTEYENAVNLAFDKLNEKVTGGMGLDYVSEEWELANQNAEMYLDTINEAFAIDQLRNKYQKSINETSNLDTQKKLNDLMEKEIAALEKKDKLTQYDVERANMKYDIALKQIALEEAQQNKTTMRLKRDSQGNYTYQYTSDDDAVADAQQQLAEAQNSLYNFDKENYQNNLDQMLSVYTEFQQKMAEAALINDEEQRQARMLMLQEQYGQLINGITAENEVIRYNLHESAFDELATNVYGKNVEEFYNMSQEEQNEIMSGLVPTWEGGVQQMADTFSDGFLPTCQDTFDQIDVGYEELKAGMSAVAEQAGIDFQTYADGTQPAIDKMKELVQDNKDVVTEMGNQLSSMQALRDQALEMDDAYKPYLNTIEDLVGKSQNLRQAEADVTTELSKQKTTLDQLTVSFTSAIAKLKEYNNTPVASKDTGGGGGGGTSGGGGGFTGGDSNDTKRTRTAYKVYQQQKSNGYTYVMETFYSEAEAKKYVEERSRTNRTGDRIYWKAITESYDTGGYTGEWVGGSQKENGKFAILHQKELVLNEQDTANFLTAIQITRGMSGVLESVANKMASIGSTFSSNVANTSNGIQQQITINADFPDATSATEIEEALLSLVNRASQQAFNVNI